MKIVKNGVEIELSLSDMIEIHKAYELECAIEDIKNVYAQKDCTVELTEKQFQEIAENALRGLSKNDSYYDAYWSSFNYAFDDYLSELEELRDYAPWHEYSLSKEECYQFVDKMVSTIRGVGINMGSGYYGLKSFAVDGEELNLYCEVSREQEDGIFYYSVYYAVEYDEGDTIFSDWAHTETLDIDELKKIVFEIASQDYSDAVKQHIEAERSVGDGHVVDMLLKDATQASEIANKDIEGLTKDDGTKEIG